MSQKLTEKEQKIAQLIYSGDPANDLLALELIKHLGVTDALYPIVLSVIFSSKEREVKHPYMALLQHQRLKDYNNLRAIIHFNNPRVQYNALEHYPSQIGSMVAYHSFKRDSHLQACNTFLRLSDKGHVHRQEVLNCLAKLHKESIKTHIRFRGYLAFVGLYSDEIKQVLNIYEANIPILKLALIGLKERELPEELYTHKPRELEVTDFVLDEFPQFVFNFPNVKMLRISECTLTGIPTDWSVFEILDTLSFNKNNFVFEDFAFADSLSKLQKLYLGSNKIKSPYHLLRKRKVPILDNLKFADDVWDSLDRAYRGQRKTELLSIAAALGKSILTEKEKRKYLDLLTSVKSLKNLPVLEVKELLLLMNVNYTPLKNELQNRINVFTGKQKGKDSLKEGANLYVLGTLKIKKTELKEQLLELGINLIQKPSEEMSHVLLGANPHKFREIEGLDYKLIQWANLKRFFKKKAPKFIEKAAMEGDSNLSEKVLRLIQNDVPSTVLLGLQMLKTGGVPEELLGPLLVVQKTCSDSKARGVAKELLEYHAPSDWLPVINDKLRFTNILTGKAQDINKKFEQLAKNISPYWAVNLSIMLHKRYQKGLRYILYNYKEPCEERTLAFKTMVKDNHLDFHSALGFTNNREKAPEEVIRYNTLRIPAKFPIDIIEHYPDLESVDCHNCKLTSIPTGIRDFKKLKHLDLSSNYLSKLPKGIEYCVELETIELYLNDFVDFPISLAKLPKLKKIDLRYNGANYSFKTVLVPQEVRDALPDCEILV